MKFRHYFPLMIALITFLLSSVALTLNVILGRYVWGAVMLLTSAVSGFGLWHELHLLRKKARFQRLPFIFK
ncbi:MAG TPA: hypothetical protein ACQGQI_08340 [Xylella sp.]